MVNHKRVYRLYREQRLGCGDGAVGGRPWDPVLCRRSQDPWHHIAPGKPAQNGLRRKLQRPAARRAPGGEGVFWMGIMNYFPPVTIKWSLSDHDSDGRSKKRRFYRRTMRVGVSDPRTLGLLSVFMKRSDGGSTAPPVDGELEAFRGQTMAGSHQITINGNSFLARRGELLLDAALSNGIDLPHDCRAGHCGTCCVRLISGEVRGGEGAEPGIVHACQCRIVGDAVIERGEPSGVRTVEGVLSSLRPLSPDVLEVGISTERALPYRAGQYARVRFSGYPSRPYSMTHPLRSEPNNGSVWFHVRRMKDGRVTSSLGKRIAPGHRVKLSGPYGSAHFRFNLDRLILVATSTGFAPIWSIAVAALRENPLRKMMIIAGARTIESLYMGPALARLSHFPNVLVVACCSTPQTLATAVKPGRPTDYLPPLLATDVALRLRRAGDS